MTEADRVVVDRVVDAEHDGVRIDVLLRAWLDEPRTRTQQRLDAGEVHADGHPVAKAHRVRAGERLTVTESAAEDTEQPEQPDPVPIRWEDEHLAVVAKPAGLVVHAGAGVTDPTLVDALRALDRPLADTGDPDRPGIVHRLDRGTSGLLVVAKTPEAHDALAAALQAREVSRSYSAIVDGVPVPARATIDAPIGRSSQRRTRFAVDDSGRRAVTHYDVVEAYGRAAVLDIGLETGRTHQIRVHLAAIGHPVAGDLAYGASPALRAELGLDRPALHARRIAFTHPITGESVEVDEPLPADFREARDRLRALR
jgi:23S rRNA pseudouridine1911/1915/1917 synthase